MLIGAVVGAAVGAGINIGSQMLSGHSVDWGEVGKQAAVGAVTGAISGLAGPEAGVLAHAAVGAASGAVGQAASNVMSNKPIGDGVLQAGAIGGVTGGLAEAAGPLMQKAGSAIIGKVGSALGSAATDAVDTASSTAVKDTATATSDVASACGLSFSADTTVTTPGGEKTIGTLQVGDLVQAFDPATKLQTTQTVQHVFINHDIDLIDVTLTLDPGTKATMNGVTGTTKQQQAAVMSHGSHAPPASQTETIHTTQKHPWLITKGWIKAGDLHLGDHVLRLDGTTATVTKLHVIPGEEDMYDLTVSNIHTFAVGQLQEIVHNAGPGNCLTGTYNQVRTGIRNDPALTGNYESHHIFQDAMMDGLPGYSYSGSPARAIAGDAQTPGTEHFLATQAQNNASAAFRASGRTSLTFGEAQAVARQSLEAAGYTGQELEDIMAYGTDYFMGRYRWADLNNLTVPLR